MNRSFRDTSMLTQFVSCRLLGGQRYEHVHYALVCLVYARQAFALHHHSRSHSQATRGIFVQSNTLRSQLHTALAHSRSGLHGGSGPPVNFRTTRGVQALLDSPALPHSCWIHGVRPLLQVGTLHGRWLPGLWLALRSWRWASRGRPIHQRRRRNYILKMFPPTAAITTTTTTTTTTKAFRIVLVLCCANPRVQAPTCCGCE